MCSDRAMAVEDDPHNKLCLGSFAHRIELWIGGLEKVARFCSAGARHLFIRTFPESITFPFAPQSSSGKMVNEESGWARGRPVGPSWHGSCLELPSYGEIIAVNLNNSVAIVVHGVSVLPRYWISALPHSLASFSDTYSRYICTCE